MTNSLGISVILKVTFGTKNAICETSIASEISLGPYYLDLYFDKCKGLHLYIEVIPLTTLHEALQAFCAKTNYFA